MQVGAQFDAIPANPKRTDAQKDENSSYQEYMFVQPPLPELPVSKPSEYDTKRSKESKQSGYNSVKNSKESQSIVGALSGEKRKKRNGTPSKRSVQFSMVDSSNKKSKKNLVTEASPKRDSGYEFPDFTIDSPKTNVNTSLKLMMNEQNFVSGDRDFNHVHLEDVLGARSLPISLMDEDIESNLES